MPLRTYQSDQAEKRASEGKGSNPLVYLGVLLGLGGAAITLSRARWALPLFFMIAVSMAVLGLTGKLAFLTPLWDAIRQGWPT